MVWQMTERADSAPQRSTTPLNFSRSSPELDRLDVGADELGAVLLEDAALVQRHRAVERGLPAEGGQHASGRSLAMIFSTTSGVIGST
jgi:hypothetical protein